MTFPTRTWTSPDGSEWLVQVFTSKGHSISCTGSSEKEATRKARLFMEGELARLQSRAARKHKLVEGRLRQSLNGKSGGCEAS